MIKRRALVHPTERQEKYRRMEIIKKANALTDEQSLSGA
jgi:hypothetical protein